MVKGGMVGRPQMLMVMMVIVGGISGWLKPATGSGMQWIMVDICMIYGSHMVNDA